MTLDTARLVFAEASPLGMALLDFQESAPVDNDYLRLAVQNGIENLALASATLHSLIGNLPSHF